MWLESPRQRGEGRKRGKGEEHAHLFILLVALSLQKGHTKEAERGKRGEIDNVAPFLRDDSVLQPSFIVYFLGKGGKPLELKSASLMPRHSPWYHLSHVSQAAKKKFSPGVLQKQ